MRPAAASLCLNSSVFERLPKDLDADASALLSAASCGATHVASLLELGFQVELRDARQRSALHLATAPRTVQLLLEARAELEAEDHQGSTPLHLAATRRSGAPTVSALLAAGANKEARDVAGQRPVDIALKAGSL